jgi:hypothetical protein
MYVARGAAAAIFCGLAATSAVFAQPREVAGKTGQLPSPAAKYDLVWPKVEPQKSPPEPTAPPTWSTQEIELARARCSVLLKGLDVIAIPEAPVRDGAECGTPAPMQLISIGSSPQVAFSPPPTLTCDMIAALHKWLQHDVQALARKHLGAPVVRIATMSSYSCRNAYGRAKGRLSEHGRMNAIDIGAFITAAGQTAMVLSGWGPNAREIAAKAAEAARKQAEAAAAAAAKAKAAEPKAAETKVADPATSASPAPVPLRPSIATTIPGVNSILPSPPAALSLSPQARLGGPKPGEPAPLVVSSPMTGTSHFLRGVHRAACRTFGTVLGPEANTYHNNHFHLDMADRSRRVICE